MVVITSAAEIDKDEVSSLLAAFDAALSAHRQLLPHARRGVHYSGTHHITIMARVCKHGAFALNLWASAHNLETREDVLRYGREPFDRNEQIRTLYAIADGKIIAVVQYDPEPIPTEVALAEVQP